MKPISLSPLGIRLSVMLVFLISFGSMNAQNTVAPTMMDTSKMTYNQISSTMKLYVFPAKGQSQGQQKKG